MEKMPAEVKLEDGTLIRHKVAGYEGRIDGTTQIKSCFTAGGISVPKFNSATIFQYRVVVAGESIRRIAPAEDLEILEGVAQIECICCGYSFRSKPGLQNKAGGTCDCGGWICPACLACQSVNNTPKKPGTPVCLKQRSRQTRKIATRKRGQ
jgi:hypothetical protein